MQFVQKKITILQSEFRVSNRYWWSLKCLRFIFVWIFFFFNHLNTCDNLNLSVPMMCEPINPRMNSHLRLLQFYPSQRRVKITSFRIVTKKLSQFLLPSHSCELKHYQKKWSQRGTFQITRKMIIENVIRMLFHSVKLVQISKKKKKIRTKHRPTSRLLAKYSLVSRLVILVRWCNMQCSNSISTNTFSTGTHIISKCQD